MYMYMYLDMNDAISAMKLCNLHWGLSGHRIACSSWMTSDPVYTDRQRVKGEREVGGGRDRGMVHTYKLLCRIMDYRGGGGEHGRIYSGSDTY